MADWESLNSKFNADVSTVEPATKPDWGSLESKFLPMDLPKAEGVRSFVPDTQLTASPEPTILDRFKRLYKPNIQKQNMIDELSKDFDLDPKEVEKNFEELASKKAKATGVGTLPTSDEFLGSMLTASLPMAAAIAGPMAVLSGVVRFMAVKEGSERVLLPAAKSIYQALNNEPVKFEVTKLREILPDVGPVRDMADLSEFIIYGAGAKSLGDVAKIPRVAGELSGFRFRVLKALGIKNEAIFQKFGTSTETALAPLTKEQMKEAFGTGVAARINPEIRQEEIAKRSTPEKVAEPLAKPLNDAEAFKIQLAESSRPGFLEQKTIQQIKDMKTFTSKDGKVGYGITKEGELVSVFNNSGKKGLLKIIMPEAILNGATSLDAYEGYLSGRYEEFGFEIVETIPWDDKFAPKGWDFDKYGRPNVVKMKLKGGKNVTDSTATDQHGQGVLRPGVNRQEGDGRGDRATKESQVAATESVEGTGDTKTRGLSLGVNEKAVKNKLTKGFSDLPEYQQVNMEAQAKLAQDLLTKSPGTATRISMGQEKPPEGLIPEAVFIAVENKAIKEGDVDTLRNLATISKLTTEATTMGQRIRTLGERDPESPIGAIKDIINTREKVAENRSKGKKINVTKKEVAKEIKSKIKKESPTISEWDSFIKGLEC